MRMTENETVMIVGASARVLAIVGPTATGKSDLAVAVAERIDGEVVNADSMQLYRGMDIGTAKLSLAQRRGVPHHLLDVLDVTETATVAAYQRAARRVVDDVLRRGRTPILVGGSGLYLRAALDDLRFPGTDPEVRAELESELAAYGSIPLHARLAEADPAAAASIHPHNGRKIIRALEVLTVTGVPFRAELPVAGVAGAYYPAAWIGVDDDPAALDRRVEARVDRMWAAGLVQEVERLVETGLRRGVTASRALGYAQVLGHLDGDYSSDEAMLRTAQATRRFVRRQRSWFRREDRIRWLEATDPQLVDRVIDEITENTAPTIQS